MIIYSYITAFVVPDDSKYIYLQSYHTTNDSKKTEMDLDDQFAELNNAFTSWLTGPTCNVTLNPKIGLTDLRASSAGRGVGVFLFQFFFLRARRIDT